MSSTNSKSSKKTTKKGTKPQSRTPGFRYQTPAFVTPLVSHELLLPSESPANIIQSSFLPSEHHANVSAFLPPSLLPSTAALHSGLIGPGSGSLPSSPQQLPSQHSATSSPIEDNWNLSSDSGKVLLTTLAQVAEKEREVSSCSSSVESLSPSPSSSEVEDQPFSSKKKEGLEDATEKIVALLQTVGHMKFKELHETLNLNYRRAYDILNVLSTTPLVSKRGKKREHDQIYLFFDGQQFSEAVNLKSINTMIESEYQRSAKLEEEIQFLKKKLVLAEAVCEDLKS